MINLLLIISIFVWPFGQLLQLTPLGSPLHLQSLDIISALLFLSLFISSSRKKITQDPLFKPLVIFCLVALLSRGDPAYLLRFVSYTSFYFAFRVVEFRRYYPYIVISSMIFMTIGLLQYFILPDTRFLTYLGFDDHYFRLIGSLLDPNFTGLVLVVFILLAPKLFFLLPLIALALTFSRASFLSLGVSLIYLAAVKKQFQLLLLLLILGIALYFVPKPFGEGVNLFRTFSIVSRLENQSQALAIFAQNPILGVGFGPRKIDSSFIFVLTTTGVVGFVSFLVFLKKAWKQTADPLVKAALLVILVHSLFNNSFFYTPVLALFFLLLNFRSSRSA
ncbi:O-antigen ligase family protein [Candidatus Collierbacteria bacterium]|nr:O-antigen ligase family protein [Candidatus Collierbacteria bacterium]